MSATIPHARAAPTERVRIAAPRPNRVADLLYLTVSLLLHGVAFVVWQLAVRQLFLAHGTGEAFAAAVFPTAILPMYTRLALGRSRMIVQVIALAFILGPLASVQHMVWVPALAGGFTGGLLVWPLSGRGSVITAGGWAGLVSAAALAITNMTRMPVPILGAGMAGAVLGGLVSGALVLALSPLAERLFGHVTALTLIESLSYDHPLLRRLLTEAPGTFLHSTNVAVLADVGANAIGANALEARVGALYHDIGKTRTPEYFSENQAPDNPHDVLSARESARVLLGHVTEGVQLVLSHRLGERVADFVREHHGSSQMRSAITRLDDAGEEGDASAFRYLGPRPRSRETAIVMLADRAEAMGRARRPMTRDACLALACEAVDRVQEEGQLGSSGLTDGDLERIEQSFADVLFAMHHRRDSYRDPQATPSRVRAPKA